MVFLIKMEFLFGFLMIYNVFFLGIGVLLKVFIMVLMFLILNFRWIEFEGWGKIWGMYFKDSCKLKLFWLYIVKK